MSIDNTNGKLELHATDIGGAWYFTLSHPHYDGNIPEVPTTDALEIAVGLHEAKLEILGSDKNKDVDRTVYTFGDVMHLLRQFRLKITKECVTDWEVSKRMSNKVFVEDMIPESWSKSQKEEFTIAIRTSPFYLSTYSEIILLSRWLKQNNYPLDKLFGTELMYNRLLSLAKHVFED